MTKISAPPRRSVQSGRVTLPLALSIATLLPCAAWADTTKAANATALNLPASWVENVVPTSTDVAVWDGSVSATNLAGQPQLGGDQSWSGIRVSNVGGTRNAANTMAGFQNASSANTLTLGSAGIDMGAATHAFTIQSRILLAADQTWNIANANTASNPLGFNNGEDLGFSALALGVPLNLGGFAVNTAGSGAVTITSGYTLSNGTLNIGNAFFVIQGGGSRASEVASSTTLNIAAGARLQFQSNSGPISSAAVMNLNGGTLQLTTNNATTAVTQSGAITVNSPSTILVGNTVTGGSSTGPVIVSGNISGSEALALNNTAANASAVLRLTGNNSGYTGTVTLGGTTGRVVRLASATAGSAAATWNVSTGQTLQVDGVTVSLGVLNGAGTITNSSTTTPAVLSVGSGLFSGLISNGVNPGTTGLTKVGPGTLTLTGANTYGGPTNVMAGTLVVTPAQVGGGEVVVSDAATLELRRLAPAGTFNTSGFTLGSAAGATLTVDFGGFGNPTTPVINAPAFAPISGSTIKLLGNLVPGTFPLVDYTGAIGGGGGAGLNLTVPFRVAASLQNNAANTSLDVVISGVETPRWDGSVNANWDVDPVGNGAQGTQNWRTLTTNSLARYIESPSGVDAVLFDDSATSTAPVNLTTTLAPTGVTLNNSSRAYTFSGFGTLTGGMALTKNGTAAFILANEAPYDFTGGTTITAGSLFLGDGITFGGGTLPGAIRNEALLVLNHPEDFTFSNPVTGAGTLRKDQVNTATIDRNTVSSMSFLVNEGSLRFTAGGNLSGMLSGTGVLEAGGGTLEISGANPNVQTQTTVSGGTLRLNKTAGVNAVGADVTISGAGVLAILAAEQIPNTGTINFLGSSADSMLGSTGAETVANVLVNASSSTGQFIMRNTFTVTGIATVQNGILGVASSHSATVNRIEMSSGSVRIAGNGGPSTLNVGAGGIAASGGVIEVKFNTANQDAVLNLGGNFTATGNVSINNGNYAGANLNLINLTATRTFDIAEGTFTNVHADFGGIGGLIKAGTGTLTLEPLSNAAHTGDTVVNAGVLEVRGAIGGSNVLVNSGTLAGSGSITTGASGLQMNTGARLMPGVPFQPGALSVTLPGSTFNIAGAVTPAASAALEFDLDGPDFSDRVIITGGALNIGSGVLEFDDFLFLPSFSFDPSATYTLFNGNTAIAGALGVRINGNVAGQPYQLQFADSGKDLVLVSVPEPGALGGLLIGIACFATRRRRAVQTG
ncbi:MAG: hypothetical protein JWQ44_2213 [Chthoniobacter sp.]|nr:hypothetical protein [Chthoniobacter sp.]